MGAKWFGASVKRTEDPALLTGRGTFVDDLHPPGLLHGAFVRSPLAHARLGAIDASAALAMPGVHAVITFADLPPSVQSQTLPLLVPSPAIRQPLMPHVLAKDEVVFVGEPVAFVVAASRALAEDAAEQVAVAYERLPAAADCRAALEPGAALAHSASPSNVAAQAVIAVGDADAAFARAPHVFREHIDQHRGGPFSLECRGIIAAWDRAAQHLTVHVSSQSAHRQKRVILDLLDLGDHQVQVVTPDVGGGFGPKGAFYAEYGAVVVASMRLGRPVKWIEDRRENFLATHQERDQHWDAEIALEADGRIIGVRGRLVHDAGAYMPWGVVLPWIAAATVPGPYVVPNYRMELVVGFTNKIATTPVRGAGRPEAVVVMERLMDRAARELGLDPAELRRRNFITPDQMPYNVGIIFRDGRPVTYDSGDYPACMAQALAAADYAGFPARQAPGARRRALSRHRHRQRGRGHRARAIRERDFAGCNQWPRRALHRRHAAGTIAQDDAGAGGGGSTGHRARHHRRGNRRHRGDRARRRQLRRADRGQGRQRRPHRRRRGGGEAQAPCCRDARGRTRKISSSLMATSRSRACRR